MTYLVKVKGARFSAPNMVEVGSTIEGLPTTDLVGLYWLDESHNPENTTGSYRDSSGHGHNAVLYSDIATPLALNHGFVGGDGNGVIFDTNIPAASLSKGFTIIWAGKNGFGDAGNNGFPTQFGISDGLPSTVTDAISNAPGIFNNIDQQSVTPLNNFGVYSKPTGRLINHASNGQANKPSILGVSVDLTLGEVSQYIHTTQAVTTHSNPMLINYHNDKKGNFVFGHWKHDSVPVSSCEVYACAIYSGSLGTGKVAKILQSMKLALEKRGVVF